MLPVYGCLARLDPYNPYMRSEFIDSSAKEAELLSRARLSWTDDRRIRVLYTCGSYYEMGYQQGALLRKEVQANLGYLHERAQKKFLSTEFFAEAFERQRPYIAEEYMDEMHGLAHGAMMPLETIHHIHALPEMSEWGGKKKIKEIAKQMLFGTSCSNICSLPGATKDGGMYTVRILDWGLHKISHLHQFPLINVAKPDHGIPYVNIGWIGFLGAISGMNAEGITLGEMGYGSPANETMSGKPMPFLLREILAKAKNLADVRRIIKDSPGTNSFVYLMSDGKSGEAEIYVRDRDRFVVFKPGQDLNDGTEKIAGINNILYGGHFNDVMHQELTRFNGELTPQLLMSEVIPKVAMRSNFQNVIYDPVNLKFWVANAQDTKSRAAEGIYSEFDFKKFLDIL